MSLSNPKLKNPCTKFIEFKGDNGIFVFWDKENKKQVLIELPCRFIVLDQLSTIKGFCQSDKSGIYSNEVHSLDETLNVKSFNKDVEFVGKYSEIKDSIKAAGGKFCKSVYVALKTDTGFELANFQFIGAAFEAWLDFTKKNNIEEYGCQVEKECTQEKNGAVKYMRPVFTRLKLSKEHINIAIAMDKQLQSYLKTYKNIAKEEVVAKEERTESEVYYDEVLQPLQSKSEAPIEEDDLPF